MVRGGHPAIKLPQQSHEEGSGAIELSARQIGNTSSRSASSAVIPHRRSTSTSSTNRSFSSALNPGDTRWTRRSRSYAKSRKVEDKNIRTVRQVGKPEGGMKITR
jgi:hypothetical protein